MQESLVVQRSEERGVGGQGSGWLHSRFSFSFAEWRSRRWLHWGPLRVLNEDTIAPRSGFGDHAHHDMEIVTYVLAGAVRHRDSMGNEGVVRPGMAQRMSAGSGVVHSEWNAEDVPCRLLQTWVFPARGAYGRPPSYEAAQIPPGAREAGWHPVADGRASAERGPGTVSMQQDAAILATRLSAGDARPLHVEEGRLGFLFVVDGAVDAGSAGRLRAGDSLRFSGPLEVPCRVETGADQSAHLLAYDLPAMATTPF